MEAFGIYILKVTVLIAVFYLAYFIFLRKETFFNSNRWFLLLGLFTSVLLPLISFTKIIWVERTPTVPDTYHPYIQNTIPAVSEPDFQINYHLIVILLYAVGILLLCIRFIAEYISLQQIIEKPKAVTKNNLYYIDTEKSPITFFFL